MPRTPVRPVAPVPRLALTRREAAASLGMSLNHFERKVQPDLKLVLCGQLVLIPVAELERWIVQGDRPQPLGLPSVSGSAGELPGHDGALDNAAGAWPPLSRPRFLEDRAQRGGDGRSPTGTGSALRAPDCDPRGELIT